MKKIVVVILTLCMLVASGVLLYADEAAEESTAIPNLTIEEPAEDNNGRVVKLDVKDEESVQDLDPVERKIVTQDTIRSNTN
jgi:hypothetical protein